MPKNGKEFFTDEEKPFSHPYDGPAARAGVYAGPAAHRGVGGGRPSSIKLEDCTHNGVHYESPSLGTCWLHQMTFDYNQKSTIGFCAEHGKGMGWSLEGQTWGNPKPITNLPCRP